MAGIKGRFRFVTIALAALFVVAGLTAMPKPAKAWFGFGWGWGYPCCAAPLPYAPYPYPPAYYPPPPPAPYYPPMAYAAPPAAAPAAPAAAGTQAAAITYTSRPAFKNASGQTCREFKTATNTLGTACRDASGQWRVSN